MTNKISKTLKVKFANVYVGTMEGIEHSGVVNDKLRDPTHTEAQRLEVFDNLNRTVDEIPASVIERLEKLETTAGKDFGEVVTDFIFSGDLALVPKDAAQFSEWLLKKHGM